MSHPDPLYDDGCPHWIELDDIQGVFEYCRAEKKRTHCCGSKSQCIYLWNRYPDYEPEVEDEKNV
jgi:hypothetical protein